LKKKLLLEWEMLKNPKLWQSKDNRNKKKNPKKKFFNGK